MKQIEIHVQKVRREGQWLKGLDISDLLPAVVTFGLIAIVAAVFALVLVNFQSNPSTFSGTGAALSGGGGSYGVFIEAGNYVNLGTVNTVGQAGGIGGGGGSGVIYVVANVYTETGAYQDGASTGTATGGAGSNTFNVVQTASFPIPIATGAQTACTNTITTTGAAGCIGNVFIMGTVTLTGPLNVSNTIVITSGNTLITNGWPVVAGNAVIISTTGNILGGFINNGGAAGSPIAAGGTGGSAIQVSNSFGGSGAGGSGCIQAGGAGGADLVAGGTAGTATNPCAAGGSGVSGKTVVGSGAGATSANTVLYAGSPGQANVLEYLSGTGAGGTGPQVNYAYNVLGFGLSGTSTLASYLPLIALVIVAAVLIGIVLLAFQFSGASRERF